MKRIKQLKHLLEYMEASQLLEALTLASSDEEFNANYEYICRMYEIPKQEEED